MAENLFEEAVQIRRQTLGCDHIEVAASLSKLGAAQIALRKFDDAYLNLRTALKITRQILGPIHKAVAQMLCHIACLFFETNEILAAQASFEDALDIYRSVWSPEDNSDHRDACMVQLTDTLCNIGSIQNRRKRYDDAINSFSEALDLQRGIVGHDDPCIISTLDNLGYAYSKKKDYLSALSCYRTMFHAQVSPKLNGNTNNGSSSSTFTKASFDTFRKKILMYEKLKRFNEAIDVIKETLQRQEKLVIRDDSLITATKALLEDVQKKLRNHEKSNNISR